MSAKPERNRLRRKLQKVNRQDVSTASSRTTTPDVRIAPPAPALYNNSSVAMPQTAKPGPVQSPACEVTSPSWDQQVYRGQRSESQLALIPEFAHLSGTRRTSVIKSARPGEATRISSHRQTPSISSVPIRERRYAKTPVLSIAQLEGASVRGPVGASKVSSVDLIAESYLQLIGSDRSLLGTPTPDALPLRRVSESTTRDIRETVIAAEAPYDSDSDYDEPTTPRAGHFTIDLDARRRPRQADSPLSDTGTLVGPEDMAIYFKPAFSPGQAPVLHDFVQHDEPPLSPPLLAPHSAASPALSMDGNPGLSICLDLLSRELLSAAAGSPMRPGSETTALQVQAMIEAYENLRDQATHLGLGNEQAVAARDMFDTWLRALRAVQAKISIRQLPARAYEWRRPMAAGGAMAELE
ncbi:hypothetical protein MN608_01211 [Microdochium nivale]|nr:hypothetical protein MN608_01211 [Microdochium nivale]